MDATQILSPILIAAGILALAVLIWLLLGLRSKLDRALGSLEQTLGSAQRTLRNVEQVSTEVTTGGLLERVKSTLAAVESGVGRIEPLTADLQTTLIEARMLLDDATQTSQSVRTRVDDLAATQKELHDLSAALADVMTQVRDGEVAAKLANVLSDTSVLIADIGLLTESAHAVLEGGRPLVENLGGVVSGARKTVKSISGAVSGIREGIKAGVENYREGDDGPA